MTLFWVYACISFLCDNINPMLVFSVAHWYSVFSSAWAYKILSLPALLWLYLPLWCSFGHWVVRKSSIFFTSTLDCFILVLILFSLVSAVVEMHRDGVFFFFISLRPWATVIIRASWQPLLDLWHVQEINLCCFMPLREGLKSIIIAVKSPVLIYTISYLLYPAKYIR